MASWADDDTMRDYRRELREDELREIADELEREDDQRAGGTGPEEGERG